MFGPGYEEDFIMRQIKSIIDAVAKIAFDADTTALRRDVQEADSLASRLIQNAAAGDIGDAEAQLMEDAAAHDPDTLRAGLAFYAYLNAQDDAFLEAHGYPREDVCDGLRRLTALYGMEQIAALFTDDD